MSFTREGKRFLFATLLVAVSAFNTGNNLIFLILALMIAMIVVALGLLKLNLARLTLSIETPSPVFAGGDALLSAVVANEKKRLPSYSIGLTAPIASAGTVLPRIGAREKRKVMMRAVFPRRGLYRYGDFYIDSGFPFIIIRQRRPLPVEGEVLVYPALIDVDELLSASHGDEGIRPMKSNAATDEMLSLREFRHGDDRRRVHWKASARASALLIKEYAEQEGMKTTIVLDNLATADAATFEKTVSLAASAAKYFIDLGYFVRILSCNKVIPFGRGEEQLFGIFDVLAVIGQCESWSGPQPEGGQGFTMGVFTSSASALRPLTAVCDLVIYAGDL